MKPSYIILHHSLTKDGSVNDWEAIRRYHKETNGWADIGYNLGIEEVDGQLVVQTGRRIGTPGAHTKEMGMNSKGVGICVVGNYDLAPPSLRYLYLLRDLCWTVMVNWSIPVEHVLGHRDVGMMAGYDWRKGEYKSCPGKLFPLSGLKDLLAGRIK